VAAAAGGGGGGLPPLHPGLVQREGSAGLLGAAPSVSGVDAAGMSSMHMLASVPSVGSALPLTREASASSLVGGSMRHSDSTGSMHMLIQQQQPQVLPQEQQQQPLLLPSSVLEAPRSGSVTATSGAPSAAVLAAAGMPVGLAGGLNPSPPLPSPPEPSPPLVTHQGLGDGALGPGSFSVHRQGSGVSVLSSNLEQPSLQQQPQQQQQMVPVQQPVPMQDTAAAAGMGGVGLNSGPAPSAGTASVGGHPGSYSSGGNVPPPLQLPSGSDLARAAVDALARNAPVGLDAIEAQLHSTGGLDADAHELDLHHLPGLDPVSVDNLVQAQTPGAANGARNNQEQSRG
jgi:hypothetical protein